MTEVNNPVPHRTRPRWVLTLLVVVTVSLLAPILLIGGCEVLATIVAAR